MDATDTDAFGVGERFERAETALCRERRRTADEAEALRVFAERVDEMAPRTAVSQGETAVRTSVAAGADDGLEAVRAAYEASVMSVPHYEEEYGDDYVESLRAEFSSDLAAALTDGTRFDARCRRAVLSATAASRSARASLLETLSGEVESLSTAAGTLGPVADELEELAARSLSEEPFGTLDAYRARLGVLAETVETAAARRQETLFDQRRETGLPTDAPDVPQYVYRTEPFDYPVMVAVAELSAAIDRLRDDIERAMARC